MQALRDHYDGPGEVEKRLSHAYKELGDAFYKSERVFTFEKYVTKLSEAFEILNDHGVGKQEREKVDILLNGIQSDNQIVVSAKTTVRMHTTMRTSFQVAVDRLSELIGSTMTIHDSKGGRPPSRRVSSINKKRKGDKGKDIVNGVDISNPHKNFTGKEWFKIPQEKREWIQRQRAEKKEAKRRKVAAATTDRGDDEPAGGSDPATNPESSQAQGDERGSGNNFGSGAYRQNRRTSSMHTMARRVASATRGPSSRSNHTPTTPNTQGRMEMDNHADTTCFSANFTPIYCTNAV